MASAHSSALNSLSSLSFRSSSSSSRFSLLPTTNKLTFPLLTKTTTLSFTTKATPFDDNSFVSEEILPVNPPEVPEGFIAPPSIFEGPDEEKDEITAAYEDIYGTAYSGVSVLGNDVYAMDSKTRKASGLRTRRKTEKLRDGFQERVVQVNRVSKVVKGGKRMSFRAIVVVGDRKGQVGIGVGKAKEVVSAIQKAAINGRRNLIKVPLTKNFTFPHRFTIVSTGGTASALESAGVAVTKVEQLTHFPEMLDGRVKTLHPNIHGGILARRDQKHHIDALTTHGIGTFDVVVVNLYPFYDKVTSAGGIEFEDGIENIDIGGPAMIRAAAKNHKDVLVVVDTEDYPALLEYLKGNQDVHFRLKLAWKAFQHVASYDSAVSEWLWKQSVGDKFPPSLSVPLSLKSSLRYGENPHQKAAFYVDKRLAEVNAGGIATAIQHHGKEMSYNNYLDADAAWNCVCEFRNPTCVVVKHTNPCGVASRDDILEAYRLAVKADPVSAFGGIVAFNVEVDEVLAKEIREFRSPTDGETRMFYEIVVAPSYTEKGLEILRGKSKTLRILEAKKNEAGKLSLRQVGGGWLAQDSDDLTPRDIKFNSVSEKTPQDGELCDAEFAWLCVKHVKSNAIVIAKDNCMLGMGSGQPNRVESLRIAMRKAGADVKGAALASDAFFPFAWKDAVEEACESGIGVIAEPGGSIRDQDAIDCCNKYGVSLLFTNVRHFRH